MSEKPLRIGIVAGEASGDTLGSELIKELKNLYPNLLIEGIAGPKMQAVGCRAIYPMDALSVMGVLEVLKRLPRILAIRYNIIKYFIANPPDIFIGIDAPDFNLTVEDKLRQAGIRTVHYVSPSVWAWKQWRLKKIARAVNLMLTILPFEKKFYDEKHIPAQFVGHPLADLIPLENDQLQARQRLTLPTDKIIVAILPGSRSNEIQYLGPLFLQTAEWLLRRNPNIIFALPMVNPMIRHQFTEVWQKEMPHLPLRLYDGQSQQVLTAADIALVASGTATLETMLVKRPMVVAYRMSGLNFFIAKRMVKTPYISLPNLLANKLLVPEFVQDQATVENIGRELLNYLQSPEILKQIGEEFEVLHKSMRCNASERAAKAIQEMLS